MGYKQTLLDAAVRTALRVGFHAMTRDDIAYDARCSTGLVSHHFGTMTALRDEVMRAAIEQGATGVVLEGLAARHPIARRAAAKVKAQAVKLLATY